MLSQKDLSSNSSMFCFVSFLWGRGIYIASPNLFPHLCNGDPSSKILLRVAVGIKSRENIKHVAT